MTKAIEAIGLTKYYDGQVALEGLDLEVEEGEVFGFLGPNGAGKTTTIRLLTGLSKPKSGVDHVLGYDIRSDIVKAKRGFGVVPELSNMYDELSGLENLVFMAQLYGVPFRERRARAEELLKTFGLYERKDSKFAAYSRGMKRALTIAAALVHRPRLLFLDEPTVGLDVVAARSLRALIQQLHGERITVFLTTHYPEEADTLSDRIALLVKGRMIAVGTPAKLKAMTNERAALEVSFKTSLPRAADELKEKLPNAELVQVDHRLRIYGGDTTAVLEAVLGYARGNATEVASVTSHNPTLEDAFVKLTGLPSKVMVAEKGGPVNMDCLRGMYYIALKDMRTYYLKPPSISWGIVFPAAWILAFYLRNPGNFEELVPGLIAMTALFSTTALEAVVINFELRLGSLERLLLAPIRLSSVLLGKALGGAVFGLIVTVVVSIGSILALALYDTNLAYLILILLRSLLVFSALGALLCLLVREVFEAQTLANPPRFVMVFLCGIFHPVSTMPPVLRHIAYVLPLTYTVDGVKQAYGASGAFPIATDVLVLIAFVLALIPPAVTLLARRFA